MIKECENLMENEVKEEKMTLGEKIKKFFVKPSEVFAQYKEEPKYGMLFLIIGIATFIITLLSRLELGSISKDQIMGSTQNAQAAEITYNLANSPVLTVITAVFAVIGVYIVIYIVAFIYYLFVKLFKGNIRYNQMVSIYSLSYMAVLIGSIIRIIYSLIAKKPFAPTTATATDVLIENINIFGIWQMVLLVFGISEVSEISKKKSIAIVIIIWVLAIGFSLAMLSVAKWAQSFAPTM